LTIIKNGGIINKKGGSMENSKKPINKTLKKFYVILGMLLILLIPVGYLNGIVKDREAYKEEAVDVVKLSWANAQTVQEPVLTLNIPEKGGIKNKDLHINQYKADIVVTTESRKKGIFHVPVYTADVKLKGNFINDYGNLKNIKADLSFNISDSKGFVSDPEFNLLDGKLVSNGTRVYSKYLTTNEKDIPFEINYKIRGINEIFVSPAGMSNEIKISGNWNNPSFEGDFLPVSKEVTNQNFNAEWNIPAIAASSIHAPKTGVSFLLPVDNYRMAERAVKYAFLFLSLTFLTYFIFEITNKKEKPIHQLQYLMIGAAMLIFYLLLISMSEFLSFWAAYAIAVIMTVSLISLYTYNVITKRKNIAFSTFISTILSLLYIFLFVLLVMQDFSLIIGSFGLFIIIALVMYVTRNVDWYGEND